MRITPGSFEKINIPEVHEALASVRALLDDRRELYRLAAAVMLGELTPPLPPEVLDSPLFRHRIADLLSGGPTLTSPEFVGIQELLGDDRLPLIARPTACAVLALALENVRRQLEVDQASPTSFRLLTESAGPAFAEARATVDAGYTMGRQILPALLDDLMSHVTLIGVVSRDTAAGLISASSRDFPGLVLITEPSSAIDVLEALVHEGAHQKLFDLEITGDYLNSVSDDCPPFRPPWHLRNRQWPMEQVLAAWHAYACLGRLASALDTTTGNLSPGSLLPVAAERCEILAAWLLDHGEYLGADAHRLLAGMLGCRPISAPAVVHRPSSYLSGSTSADGIESVRVKSGDRDLVCYRSTPPSFVWFAR